MRHKKQLPFDPRVTTFHEESRTFEEVIFHFMSLEDRKRWLHSAAIEDLRVFQTGYFKKAHGHSVERRNLDESVLIYCVGGKGRYTRGKSSWSIGAGDLLYISPKTHHKYEADERDPWTIHWMHISGARMNLYRRLIGFTQEAPVIRLGMHIEIIDLFKSFYSLYGTTNDEVHFAAMYACAQHILAAAAFAQRPANTWPQWESEIQSVIAYMELSVDRKLRLEDFSAYLGLSRFHFSRRFKSMTGVSPMKYFMNLKMKKACLLLESSSLKVKAIAEQLSFDSEYYFSRCFKACVGCSPQHYSKNQ